MSICYFKPYHDRTKDPLRPLRELCLELFPKPYAAAPLQKITAVGAFNYTHRHALTEDDVEWLDGMIRMCAAHDSAPIADDFILVSLAMGMGEDKEKKHDFLLKTQPKTDLLAICNIFHPPGSMAKHAGVLTGQISFGALLDDCWARAGRDSGASVVATAGWSKSEVHNIHFVEPVDDKVLYNVPTLKRPELIGYQSGHFSIAFRNAV